MGFGNVLFGVVISVVLTGIATAVTMPFVGAMVRLRANYNPKAVDLEGGNKRVGPSLTTIFGILRRTKRLEGWYGLYKGAYPTFAFTSLLLVLSMVIGGSSVVVPLVTGTLPTVEGSSTIILSTIFSLLLTVITLPMTVVINRCIVTPYRLPTDPSQALKLILSPREYNTPFNIFRAPGLLLTTFLTSISVTFIAQTVRLVVLGPRNTWVDATWWQWTLAAVWQMLATSCLTPLYVVSTRLSIQPNMGSRFLEADDAKPAGVELCGNGEDVIGLRPASEPYLGMLDCERKILSEEGLGALYRGWAWTLLGNVLVLGN